MLAGHFPLTFGQEHAWLVLLAIFAIVVAIRHFFNLWHAGKRAWWILGAATAGAIALAVMLAPEDVETVDLASDGEAAMIVAQRCAVCHSGVSAPLGVELPRRRSDQALRARDRGAGRARARCRPGTGPA